MKGKILVVVLVIVLTGCRSVIRDERAGSSTKSDKEEYYIIKGINYSVQGENLLALKEYEKAYEKNDENPITLRELGYTYGVLGDDEKGVEYLNKALEIDPRDQLALKNLGTLEYNRGNYEKAYEILKKIPKENYDKDTYKLLGYTAINLKKKREGETAFERGMNLLDGYDDNLVKGYIKVLEDQGKDGEIYEVLDRLYGENKGEKDLVLFYSEKLEEEFGEREKAKEILKRYLAFVELDDDVLLLLGSYNLKDKEVKDTEVVLSLVSEGKRYSSSYLKVKKEVEDLERVGI